MTCNDQDAAGTLCQVLKEALADGQQGPVVALEDGGGGHHKLGLRVHLRQLIKALTNPGPPNQARSQPRTSRGMLRAHGLVLGSCFQAFVLLVSVNPAVKCRCTVGLIR